MEEIEEKEEMEEIEYTPNMSPRCHQTDYRKNNWSEWKSKKVVLWRGLIVAHVNVKSSCQIRANKDV